MCTVDHIDLRKLCTHVIVWLIMYLCFSRQVFDAFNPRLTDRNSKVNLRALEAFSNMVPLLGSLLAPLSANIIKALMPNLGSKNSGIYHSATNAFDLFSQCIGESLIYCV